MTGFKGRLAATTAAVLAVGLLAHGAAAQKRSEAEAAAHGAAVSRPMPSLGIGGTADQRTGTKADGTGGAGMSSGTTAGGGTGMTGAATGGRSMGKMTAGQVRTLQQALNGQGANLKVDGKIGPNTRRALMDYQARNGLPVTGQADAATMAKLGV